MKKSIVYGRNIVCVWFSGEIEFHKWNMKFGGRKWSWSIALYKSEWKFVNVIVNESKHFFMEMCLEGFYYWLDRTTKEYVVCFLFKVIKNNSFPIGW